MPRKRMKGCTYSKVSQQQKFIFLKLCITDKQSIHDAAFNAGIHYSTAKTILFFHKKNYKNYANYHVDDPNEEDNNTEGIYAGYRVIPIDLEGHYPSKSQVEIVVNQKITKVEGTRTTNTLNQKPKVEDDDVSHQIKVEEKQEQLMRPVKEEIYASRPNVLFQWMQQQKGNLGYSSFDNNSMLMMKKIQNGQ